MSSKKHARNLGICLAALVFASAAQGQVSGWVWGLILAVVIIGIFWWWLRGFPREEKGPTFRDWQEGEEQRMAASAIPTTGPAPVITQDDLTLIEGIGPKIARLLSEAGITNFDELAHTDTARLDAILNAAGLYIADPRSWPEQASLASKGALDELRDLQAHLKAGRAI